MRATHTFTVSNIKTFKKQLLSWSQQYDKVVWLETNHWQDTHSQLPAVLAVGAHKQLKTDYKGAFDKLQAFQTEVSDWLFGYLSYDLKNGIEALSSNNFDGLQFPDLYFFQPKKLILVYNDTVQFQYIQALETDIQADFLAISSKVLKNEQPANAPVKIKLRLPKAQYINKVKCLLEHMHRGDIYEANFCQEFYATNAYINPEQVYNKLNNISKPPFACFLKIDQKYAMSASPERYLKKQGCQVVSQPIKGTAKRSKNPIKDQQLKDSLANDAKELSENVMIVDLVRNDLSHTALKGSVKVDELCKVYSFKQVHQMISTVSSQIAKNTLPVEVIKTTFPMGSMTGAPKISAMRIIEALETTKRSLYSGAIGYFTPTGDFDFNVVIRSILYNQTNKYLSYSVGSAITARSEPSREYQECLIKAKAMREVLEG